MTTKTIAKSKARIRQNGTSLVITITPYCNFLEAECGTELDVCTAWGKFGKFLYLKNPNRTPLEDSKL